MEPKGSEKASLPSSPRESPGKFPGVGLSAGTSPALGPVGLTSSSRVHCGPLIAGTRQVTLTRPQSRFPGLTESRARGAGWQVGPEGLNPHARAARGAGRPPPCLPAARPPSGGSRGLSPRAARTRAITSTCEVVFPGAKAWPPRGRAGPDRAAGSVGRERLSGARRFCSSSLPCDLRGAAGLRRQSRHRGGDAPSGCHTCVAANRLRTSSYDFKIRQLKL